ncbi:hypothetical protein D3C83_335540 [compost metagenome]
MAEGRVAGAEIVERDAAAEIAHFGDEVCRLVDVLERHRLRDLDRHSLGDLALSAQQRDQEPEP